MRLLSRLRRLPRLRSRGMLLWLFTLVLGVSCQGQGGRPFVIVTLEGRSPEVTAILAQVTLVGRSTTEEFRGNDDLSSFSIGLPVDARGLLDIQVSGLDGNGCKFTGGQSAVEITANETYHVALMLNLLSLPECPPVALTVQKSGDGKGTVASSPVGLDCGDTCPSSSASFFPGTVITLTATPAVTPSQSAVFLGWSGGGCSGTGPCTLTLAQATTVTAEFGCRGWCSEPLPGDVTVLRGLWASGPGSIVAVGDGGTILRWDGSAWTRRTSGVQGTLRGVTGVAATPRLFAVGDGGTILTSSDDGVQWSSMSSPVTAELRGVWAASATEAYAVGANIASGQPYLQFNGSTWSVVSRAGLDQNWQAVHGYGPGGFLIVGGSGSHARFTGGTPATMPTTGTLSPLYGAWAGSQSFLMAVGQDGTAVRWTGLAWAATQIAASGISLRGIHGTSVSNLYAVGDMGTILRYDGSNWSLVPSGNESRLFDVFALPDGNIYAVGAGSSILHYRP